MSNLLSIVEISIKPQQRSVYLEALRELVRASTASGAILSHDIHIDPRNPSKCVVTVLWTSKEAMLAYQNGDQIKDFMNKTAFCLSGPSLYKTFTIESEQTLL